jgi:HK97 gp10 family phage protein
MKDLMRKFELLSSPSAKKDVRRGLGKAANFIRDRVKRLAPRDEGNLKKAIVARMIKGRKWIHGGAYVTVDRRILEEAGISIYPLVGQKYPRADYPFYVEFGGKNGRMAARPYFRPGIESSIPMVTTMLARAVKRHVTEVAVKK